MAKLVEAILAFFQWFAIQVGIGGALGLLAFAFVSAVAWRLYTDKREDQKRLQELSEKNRTIEILQRELNHYKAKELVHHYGISLVDAYHYIGIEPPSPGGALSTGQTQEARHD